MRDLRIHVLTIQRLPAGWTGKTHALQRAAREARGDWFWFIDADTDHAPESLSTLMEYARSQGASLVSLLPELRCETFWEKVVQPLAAIALMQSFPLNVVNDDRSRLAFANGQYILIERPAYLAAGGHEAVRDRFVEDIALAKRVKGLGLPIRVALARGLVTCRMYSSLAQLVRGWSRILYDALDRKAWRLSLNLLDGLVISQTAHVAFVAGLALWLAGAQAVGELAGRALRGSSCLDVPGLPPGLPDVGSRFAPCRMVSPGQLHRQRDSDPGDPNVFHRAGHVERHPLHKGTHFRHRCADRIERLRIRPQGCRACLIDLC